MIYTIQIDDDVIFLEHDCSPFLKIYKNDYINYKYFDPSENNCIEKITEYIDDLSKKIKF